MGISGLPDDARRAVYDVAFFFQGFATLRLLDVLDEEIMPTTRPRLVAVWEAVEPYVERERELHGYSGIYFLRVLEEFVKEAKICRQDRSIRCSRADDLLRSSAVSVANRQRRP